MNRNRRSCPRFLARVAALLAVSLLATAASAASKPTITMKDLLNSERISGAQFAPVGGAYAFVRGIPMAEQASWGFQDADDLVRSRVFVVTYPDAVPKEIPNTRDTRYSLARVGGWSPDGRKLLLMTTTRKGYGLAIYDLASEKILRLPGYIKNFFPLVEWTGDDRLIYYAIPEGARQRGADHQVLADVTERWTAAWNGDATQVTVSSTSPVFESSEPASGSLMLADPQSGTTQKIATGDYYAIVVSPDDRHIAAVRAAEKTANGINPLGHRGELQIFGLNATDGARLLYHYADVDTSAVVRGGVSLAWSPAGDRLLSVGASVGSGRSDTHLYVVDIGTGQLRQLKTPAKLSFVNPTALGWGMALPVGWVGELPAAVAAREDVVGGAGSDRPPEVGTHMNYGGVQKVRYDVYAFGKGGAPKNLTAFAKGSVNQFVVSSDAHGMLVVAEGALWKLIPGEEPVRLSGQGAPRIVGFGLDRYQPLISAYYRSATEERIGLMALVDGKPGRVVLDLNSGELTALKVRGEIAATAANQMDTLSKLDRGWTSTLLLNGDGGDEQTILTVNADLKGTAVAEATSFTFNYKDKSLTGWLLLPPDAKPGVPLPAVVSVYGGTVYSPNRPPSATKPGYSVPVLSGQLLAARGYAVIYPSTPLGEGSSTNVMATLAGEAVAAADAVAAKGLIDPRRVGVMGQSFGGFSTAAILAERSDYFRAGVSMAGVYGWIGAYGMVRMGDMLSDGGNIFALEMRMVEDGQIRLGKPFWQAPEGYMRNSPIFHVEGINSPLLMLHGDLDLATTGLPGAIRMYNALLKANKKNVALVRYWGQGHVADSAWAFRDQWSRITAWFDHYLKASQNSH